MIEGGRSAYRGYKVIYSQSFGTITIGAQKAYPINLPHFNMMGIIVGAVGTVTEESFIKRVEQLRNIGAKYVTLETGAYRPVDIARAVKFSSLAKIDYLTVDAAGGTGMSLWCR